MLPNVMQFSFPKQMAFLLFINSLILYFVIFFYFNQIAMSDNTNYIILLFSSFIHKLLFLMSLGECYNLSC